MKKEVSVITCASPVDFRETKNIQLVKFSEAWLFPSAMATS